ncbi:MAG: hemerythrin domain-containing protein [Gallionella sp.]|nr:hemerythrin domain-containing protein [Gallionella sp.]
MSKIAEYLGSDHQRCDVAFADAEAAALSGDWDTAQTAFTAFQNDMAKHFRMEEEILFPALLAANGPSGPVQVMRMEHAQMNDLLDQLADALQARSHSFGGIAETLLIVMQQHNLKEEQILYPIADRLLESACDEIIARMQAI